MPRPETPALTVDIIIELHDRPEKPVVLIERKYPPLGWALPGGFVDVGETVSTVDGQWLVIYPGDSCRRR